MNLEYILYNLKEAKAELDKMIKKIEKDENYDSGEFVVAISHLYHHVNTAWNSRNASMNEVKECSDKNFKKWHKFPKVDEILLDS
jgi:hypothetical protein